MSRQAMQMALDALVWEAGSEPAMYAAQTAKAITALRAALAEPEQEPVARAWQEGYNQGIEDERISEASIGIVGFGAKVEPARQNPYKTTAPTPRKPLSEQELDAMRQADGGALNFVTLRAFRVVARAVERAHGIGERT